MYCTHANKSPAMQLRGMTSRIEDSKISFAAETIVLKRLRQELDERTEHSMPHAPMKYIMGHAASHQPKIQIKDRTPSMPAKTTAGIP
jgi:hypothetical protein